MHLTVAHTWDHQPLPAAEQTHFRLRPTASGLELTVDAPWAGDPPPPGPPGPVDGLWDFEVCELMLLGADARYLEVELGPHGHHLVLQLHGVRRIVARGLPLDYTVHRLGPDRWQGIARIPAAWLPPGLDRLNAFALRGQGSARRAHAWRPAGGPAPDFHRLEVFGPLPPALLRA